MITTPSGARRRLGCRNQIAIVLGADPPASVDLVLAAERRTAGRSSAAGAGAAGAGSP